MKSNKIIVFDFCGTLVSLQTADLFVSYVLQKKQKYLSYIYSIMLRKFFRNKKFVLLSLLKGINEEDLNSCAISFAKYLKKYTNNNVFLRLINLLKQEKNQIFLISAGYSIYIKHFFKDQNIHIISNDFNFKNDVFQGSIMGKDCFGKRKVKRLLKVVNNHNFSDKNFLISESYSDSLSDKPIFNISKKKFFINKEKIELLHDF
tara:strand:+ start:521 stop:1132 length:612 start_codon:yes stop_codon:yes gene_type:complete